MLVRDDGSVLTELGAIATWLARTNPQANLLPPKAEDEAGVREVVDYVVGTLHGQGLGRIFMPARFAPPDASKEARDGVQRQSRQRHPLAAQAGDPLRAHEGAVGGAAGDGDLGRAGLIRTRSCASRQASLRVQPIA